MYNTKFIASDFVACIVAGICGIELLLCCLKYPVMFVAVFIGILVILSYVLFCYIFN